MRRIAWILGAAVVVATAASPALADQQADRAAAQNIARSLKASGKLKDYRVGVKFQDGVAWLLGSVTSEEQRAIAEKLAYRAEGVEKVINKLEIVAPEPELPELEEAELVEPQQVDRQVQPAGLQAAPLAAADGPAPAYLRSGPARRQARSNMPVPYAVSGPNGVRSASYGYCPPGMGGELGGSTLGPDPSMGGPQPMPMSHVPSAPGRTVSYDNPQMPNYAWPSYAAYPNYAALTYPTQYSPSAWPYIGPFYPYPQVPLGWRKVTLEWDDGWWFLDFSDCKDCH